MSGTSGAAVFVARDVDDLAPPETVEALLFDLDGTLVDSFAANLAAYNSALVPHGISLPVEWFRLRFGKPAPIVLAEVEDEWRVRIDATEVIAAKNRAYLHELRSVRLFPPMRELIARHSASKAMAVVTSSPRVTATALLDRLGIAGQVTALVARDDVEATKPSPEPFSLAVTMLGTTTGRCLAYEDSDEGVASALSAGLDVIDVRHVFSPATGADEG